MALPKLLDKVAVELPFMPMTNTKKEGTVIYINKKNNWFLAQFEGKGGSYCLGFTGTGNGWNDGQLMRSPKRRAI